MDPSDVDLTQVIQPPEDTEDQNGNNNIHAVLKVEVDVSPPKFLTFTLKAGTNLIGRSHSCDVIIGNNAVSKQHARLELDRNGITIMDLGSQNKTKIGKRALKPRVYFNLDYNETFFLAGIPAHVIRDNDDVPGGDTSSDTCSESLLNAAEIVKDQAGVAEPVVHSNSSTADCHGERVDGELEASSSTAGGKHFAKPSSQSDSKLPNSHESKSSGSFNLPEMPSLEYTQSDSSQLAEVCAEDGSHRNSGAAENALAPAGDYPSVSNAAAPKDTADAVKTDSHLTAETQPYADDEEFEKAACVLQDRLPGDMTEEMDRLNAPTQPYNTQYSEVTFVRQDGLPGDEADEADRLNAPTQPYNTQYSEGICVRPDGLPGDIMDETDRLNAPTQPYNTQYSEGICLQPDGLPGDITDEADRLNAPTQPYNTQYTEGTCVRPDGLLGDEADEHDRLNAPTQPYVDEQSTKAAAVLSGADADEDDCFVAPTQGFEDEEEQGEFRNAAALTSVADNEEERLNAVTQSFDDDDDRIKREEAGNHTLAGDKRRLLSSADLSFVLCEATQPDKEEEEDYFCPPTQDTSPNLKVLALLKSRKERREAADKEGNKTDDEMDDETPSLSPKTTVDETPPQSPSFVPESDPEDDDGSMVTARYSLSLLNSSSLTVYEDCLTPGPGFGSPVIGAIASAGRTSSAKSKTGEKRQRRKMSLKKPIPETILEHPNQESDAGVEDVEVEELGLAKTARRLDFVEGAEAGNGNESANAVDISGVGDILSKISECSEGATSDTKAMPSPAGLQVGRPSAGGPDASMKDDAAEDNEGPFLHMSEMGDLDTQATDTAASIAADQDSGVAEGNGQNTNALEEAVPEKCEDMASAQALNDKSAEARDGPRDKISVVESKDTASKETVSDDEEPVSVDAGGKDGQEKELSETEEEGGRTSTVKGRKKRVSPAKKAGSKKEVAPPSSKKKAAAERTEVAPRRSSGRQNAGAKMKALLSLEKRTSASGKFREKGLLQETREKQDASDSTDTQEAEDKVPRRVSKRGRKESAKEAASLSERDPASEVGEQGQRSEASNSKDVGADKEEATKVASVLPPSDSIADDYLNATIDTCFSEPFPSFSQVLAECRDPEKAAAEEILKREQKEELEEKSPESPVKDSASVLEESAVEANQDSKPEDSAEALQSRSSKGDAVVIRSTRKKGVVDTEDPSMYLNTPRNTAEDSLPVDSEVLVEDTEFQELEAPKSASSRCPQNVLPFLVEPKTRGRKSKQLVVVDETEKLEDDTGVGEMCTESEDTLTELQQADAPDPAPSQRSRRTGQGVPPSAVVPKRAGRKAPEVVAETEQPEDITKVNDARAQSDAEEGTPSELEKAEAPEAATSRRPQRTRRETSTSAVGPRSAGRKIKQLEVGEQTERLEEEAEPDEDTPSELEQPEAPEPTSSQGSRRRGRRTSAPAIEPKRSRRKAKQPEVVEETERLEEEAEPDEETPSELGQSEVPEPTSQGSQRRGRRTTPPAIEPKRSRRKAKQAEVVEGTERLEEAEPDEDTLSELGQSEAPEPTSSQGSQRRGRRTSPPSIEPKRSRRKAKQPEVEETERLEEEAQPDEDTPSELGQSEAPEPTLSQGSQRRGRRTTPPAIELKRLRRKTKQSEVVEEPEHLEEQAEPDEDTPSELGQSEAPEPTSSQGSRRTSPPATEPKRSRRKAQQPEVVEETERLEEEAEPDEETPSELGQYEAPEPTSSQGSQRRRRGTSPPAIKPKRSRRKAKQPVVFEETQHPEDGEKDGEAENSAYENTPGELGHSEAPEPASSQGPQRRGRRTSPAIKPKRSLRKEKQPVVIEETGHLEDETEGNDGQGKDSADEDTSSDLGQSEAREPTSSRGSQRTRRGALVPTIEPKRLQHKGKPFKDGEESELPEDKAEMESVHVGGEAERPSRAKKRATPSQEEKPTPHPHSSKVSRLGLKQGEQSRKPNADAELLDGPAPNASGDQTGATGSQNAGNIQGKRGTRLSSDRNSNAVADDSDFEPTESQSSRAFQRRKKGQKLSQKQSSKSCVADSLDDSGLNTSVGSETWMGSQGRRKGLKKFQGRADLPHDKDTAQDSFKSTPALNEAAEDNLLADASLLDVSQSVRRLPYVKVERLSQEEGHQPLVDKATPAEAQSSKTSRGTGKGSKLSKPEDQTPSSGTAIISIPDESIAEPKLETLGASRRGRGRPRKLEVHDDAPAVESVLSNAMEDSVASAETRNVRAPRGGKKGATNSSQDQENKNHESSAVSAVEEGSQAPATEGPTTSQRMGVRADQSKNRHNRVSEEKSFATATEAVSKMIQRGRKTKASLAQANKEQPQKCEPIKSSSRSIKHNVDEADVVAEAIDEPPKKLLTRSRGSKNTPAARAPPAKRRNVPGKVNEDLPPDSAMATEETLDETLPNCPLPKIAKMKRPAASMSFGVGRRESDGEATSVEEVELEETEMMPGPKSKRNPAAKNIIKQEPTTEAPKRGKRKAAMAEDVAVGTPPKVKAGPAEQDVLSPPNAKKAPKRKPKILFTGIECTNEEEIVKRLGGAIATTASMCSHLVTDKFRRTVKSLCCIGKGTPIVDIAWIKKCQEAKTFVEHTPYLLKDAKAEKALKFVLGETLRQAASSGGVLQGWSIHATDRVLPPPADLKEIVSCAGGKYLAKMPTRATSGATVIVSCKEDLKGCTQAKKNGVPIVSVEFVLSGLLQYKLDVSAHALN